MLRETDEFDAQGFSFADFGEQKAPALVSVEHGAHGAAATIADAHLLFNSDFTRSGNDLHIDGYNGDRAIVRDYFGAGERAALMSSEGARLSPDLVEALTKSVAPHQYAQATPPAPAASDAVGRVVTASPDSTILRNGVPVTVQPGDPVLRADVLQTAGGTMAVTFNDGSTLNLTANTRIVVSEFIYSPSNTGNSQLLDLVQGSLTFISGEIAHTGNMSIGTPVATMGIRGTVGGVTTASDGTVQFYVSQSATGAVIINQQGQIIANVVQDGPLIVVRPVGPLEVIADEIQKSPAQLAAELQALQQIVNIKAVGDQLLQQFFQQQQQSPNPQSPQNGPHTQIPGGDNVKITLFQDNNEGDNGITSPPTHAVIETNLNDPEAPPTQIPVTIPVNLPPVTFAPLSATTAEDTSVVFNGPRSISIVDNDSSVLTVTLSVTNGVLSLGSVTGLSFSVGDGASDGTLTFSGSPAAIAAALNGLTYTPAQDYNGAAVLSITKTDGNSAPTTTAVVLNVTPVNDAPVIVGSATVDLPQIVGAVPSGNLEPGTALTEQPGWPAVTLALEGLLTAPGSVTDVLATVREELGVDTATAMTVVWDYLDDLYVSNGPNEIEINEAFTRLGVEYARYVKDGGAPLTNITAKYTADGADNGTAPDRVQSLHDNLLGNLGLAALDQRYGGNQALLAELTALINAVDPDLVTRPYYDGGETHGAAAAAVQAWDVANGFAPAVFTENGAPAVVNAALTLSDVDSTTLAGATVKIAGVQPGEVLDFTAQGGITGSYNAQTGILTLSGTASLANYQAVLRSVTYENTSDNPSGDARTITFQVDDGAAQHADSNVVAVSVNVTPVNDAPVIVGSATVDLPQIVGAVPSGNLEPGTALTEQPGWPAVTLALEGLLTAPGGVIAALETVQDQLNVDTATAMTVVWDYLDDRYVSHGPHEIEINEAFVRLGVEYAKHVKAGGAPLVNITAKYTADVNVNGTPDRVQSLHDNLLGNLGSGPLQSRFGSNPSLRDELTVLVSSVDPDLLTRPYYDGGEGSSAASVRQWDLDNGFAPGTPPGYTENGSPAYVASSLTLSDVDSATLASATVKIAGGFQAGDVLSFTPRGNITGSYDAGTLTLSGDASLADYQAVLRSVTYQHTSEDPSGNARTITFQVNDGAAQHSQSNVVAVTVNMDTVNDAPSLLLGAFVEDRFDTQSYSLNSGTANWTSSWVEEGDDNSPATGEIRIGSDPSVSGSGYRLVLSDDDGETAAADTIQRTADLSVASSAKLIFDYRRQIESSDSDAVVEILASTNGSAFSKIGEIGGVGGTYVDADYQQFSLDISGYISPATTIRFSIGDHVNDEDLFFIDNVRIEYSASSTYTEGGAPVSIAPLGVAIRDPDDTTLQSATITLTNAQADDLLSVSGSLPSGIDASSYNADTGILTLTGEATLADYQTALAQILFSNTGDDPGNADRTITVVVSDGSANSNQATVTVKVTPVNDAPVAVGSVPIVLPPIELPLIVEANVEVNSVFELEPKAALETQITNNNIVTDALTGLLTVPAGLSVALETTRTGLGLDYLTALTVVWDFLDDRYVSHGPNEIQINEAFVRLGVEYAAYLKAGGAPLLDITAKFAADGNSNGTPDREQSLHDNLLGNLGAGPLLGRFGSDSTLHDELTDLIGQVDANLLNRPFYSGNESATAAASAVQAWDLAHGYTTAAAGMLIATDADNNTPLIWSVATTAGTYGHFALNSATGVWTYKLDSGLPAQLAQGETATETFTATVTDGHGATDTLDVVITLTGTNGVPVVSVPGDNLMFASADPDIFVFAPASGHDTVVGFDVADDVIDVSGFGILDSDTAALQAFMDSAIDHDNGLVLVYDNDLLFLQGVDSITLANLHGVVV